MDRVADRLAKELYSHLSLKTPPRILREMGWDDWLAKCVPLSDNPATIASHAFVYLFLDGKYPGNVLQGLSAVLAFLREKMGHFPSEKDLQRLKRILSENPEVDVRKVHDWFASVYPK